MMQRYSILTRRAHFSQKTREMGHPDYLWVGEVGPRPVSPIPPAANKQVGQGISPNTPSRKYWRVRPAVVN
jgi:hypothetical protein